MGEQRVWSTQNDISCEEIEALHAAYDLAWSDLHMGGKDGTLVFRSQGEFANRKLAEMMKSGDRECTKVLGPGHEVICSDAVELIESLGGEEKGWWYWTRNGLLALASMIGIGGSFAITNRHYNDWMDARKRSSQNQSSSESASYLAIAGLGALAVVLSVAAAASIADDALGVIGDEFIACPAAAGAWGNYLHAFGL